MVPEVVLVRTELVVVGVEVPGLLQTNRMIRPVVSCSDGLLHIPLAVPLV